jgi:hypothetical protein
LLPNEFEDTRVRVFYYGFRLLTFSLASQIFERKLWQSHSAGCQSAKPRKKSPKAKFAEGDPRKKSFLTKGRKSLKRVFINRLRVPNETLYFGLIFGARCASSCLFLAAHFTKV